MSFFPLHLSRTSVCGSGTGSVWMSRPFTAENNAVLAPMPSISESTTTVVHPFVRRRVRNAYLRS